MHASPKTIAGPKVVISGLVHSTFEPPLQGARRSTNGHYEVSFQAVHIQALLSDQRVVPEERWAQTAGPGGGEAPYGETPLSRVSALYPQKYPQIPPDTSGTLWTTTDGPNTEKACRSMTYRLFLEPVGSWYGGAERVRTADLRLAKPALSQLSYCPLCVACCRVSGTPRQSHAASVARRVSGTKSQSPEGMSERTSRQGF